MYKTAIIILLIILLIIHLTFPQILLDNVIPLFTFLAVSLVIMCSCKESLINNKLFSGGVGDANPDPDPDWDTLHSDLKTLVNEFEPDSDYWDKLPKDLLNIVDKFEQQPTKKLKFSKRYNSEDEFNNDIVEKISDSNNRMEVIKVVIISNNNFINEKHFNALSLLKGLQHIKIVNCNGINIIPSISKIITLSITDCDNVIKVMTMSDLKNLNLHKCKKLNCIETMPELENLKADMCYEIKKINDMPKLKRLELRWCLWLTNLGIMPKLETLSLNGCLSLSHMPEMPMIKNKIIHKSPVSNIDEEMLDYFRHEHRYNPNNYIPDYGVKILDKAAILDILKSRNEMNDYIIGFNKSILHEYKFCIKYTENDRYDPTDDWTDGIKTSRDRIIILKNLEEKKKKEIKIADDKLAKYPSELVSQLLNTPEQLLFEKKIKDSFISFENENKNLKQIEDENNRKWKENNRKWEENKTTSLAQVEKENNRKLEENKPIKNTQASNNSDCSIM